MTTYLVLTLIGKDKPGLVEQLAETIAIHSGNWLESSMSQLAGKFAGILRVSVPDEQADNLTAALGNLSSVLKLVIEKAEPESATENQQTVTLNLVGNDRPSIIREISHVLAKLGVNVEDLETDCVPAPMTGDVLFKAQAQLKVPSETELATLQTALEKLADDLIVEIQLG
jgi:glycine cleavage system regulatory protein